MIKLIAVEFRKLRGSLALPLALTAPALPALLIFLATATSRHNTTWLMIYSGFVVPIWNLLLFPMTIAAFTALLAQIEYRSKGWDHILALPIPRWQIFLSKTIVTFAVSATMPVLAIASGWLGATLGGLISGHIPLGMFPWKKLIITFALLQAASSIVIVVQVWIALRYASFVLPLMVGITGTLVAMAIALTRSTQANWFPWVIPGHILTSSNPVQTAFVALTVTLILLVLMLMDLTRHTFR